MPIVLAGLRGDKRIDGAGERNRTPDRLITNQLLYLLSYASAGIKSTVVLLRSAIVPISAIEVKLWSPSPLR